MPDIALAFNPYRVGSETANEDLVSVTRLADDLGYHTFFTGESWGTDALTVLTAVACHTKNIRVGAGILPVFSRTPALIAQSIASLDQISNGRATLGLGTSGRIVIENWHGLPYQRPLQRTEEYIQIIRQALSGEPVNFQGAFFRVVPVPAGGRPGPEPDSNLPGQPRPQEPGIDRAAGRRLAADLAAPGQGAGIERTHRPGRRRRRKGHVRHHRSAPDHVLRHGRPR